jgi:hypothetical protein
MDNVYRVWSRFPSGNWLRERSFMIKSYAQDFINFRKKKDAEMGDKREYMITVNDKEPSDG